MQTIMRRFVRLSLMSFVSFVPSPRPTPKIGPISGETSMAPMITATEFTFRPTEASTIANPRIQAFGPRKAIPPRIFSAADSQSM